MQLLALVLVWPALLLVLAVLFVSLGNLNYVLVIPAFIVMLILISVFNDGKDNNLGDQSFHAGDLEKIRRGVITFSIGIFFPLFVRYFLTSFYPSSKVITLVIAMLIAFGVLTWGIFIHQNKALKYANLIGGILAVCYLYAELWNMGQLAQVAGAATGLVAAAAISIIKLKDKLV